MTEGLFEANTTPREYLTLQRGFNIETNISSDGDEASVEQAVRLDEKLQPTTLKKPQHTRK